MDVARVGRGALSLDDITPVILTLNEAPNLERCLQQLRWAKRVVIVDSGSSDETPVIAARHDNVDFIVRAFDDHTSQWNYALGVARTDWVLSLDADYVLGSGFESELRSLVVGDEIDAWEAAFRYTVFGRPLRASLYPPRLVLFRRDRCHYEQDGHTQLLRARGATGRLRTPIEHDDRKPLARWLAAQDRYAVLEAEKLASASRDSLGLPDRLRRTGWAAIPATLVYTLLVKGTIRDGWRGWYYALQRTLAEILLALRLLEISLRRQRD